MVSAKITKDSKKVFRQTFKNGVNNALTEALNNSVREINNEYNWRTPKKTGNLRARKGIKIYPASGLKARLHFKYYAPYASYQYHNHFENYTTPGTDGEWDKGSELSYKIKNIVQRNLLIALKRQFG
jgi:hypothetical protein